MTEPGSESGDREEDQAARRRLEIIRRSRAEMDRQNIERVRNVYQEPGPGDSD